MNFIFHIVIYCFSFYYLNCFLQLPFIIVASAEMGTGNIKGFPGLLREVQLLRRVFQVIVKCILSVENNLLDYTMVLSHKVFHLDQLLIMTHTMSHTV